MAWKLGVNALRAFGAVQSGPSLFQVFLVVVILFLSIDSVTAAPLGAVTGLTRRDSETPVAGYGLWKWAEVPGLTFVEEHGQSEHGSLGSSLDPSRPLAVNVAEKSTLYGLLRTALRLPRVIWMKLHRDIFNTASTVSSPKTPDLGQVRTRAYDVISAPNSLVKPILTMERVTTTAEEELHKMLALFEDILY
jgi:hypothetical protein